jgi:hypothetical protein
MNKFLLPVFIFIGFGATAQLPESSLRFGYLPQAGTARSLAIGGAMGSLGGDLSANYVNPAGLGNYKTGEFTFTPGMMFNKNSSDYRESKLSSEKSAFNFGNLGFILGAPNEYNAKKSSAFAISFSQQASFKNNVSYKGYNNYSSFAEQWAEELSKSGQTLNDALNNPSFAFGTAPAVYTYLVDTFNINGTLLVKSLPEFILENGNALSQEKTFATKGGLYELNIGYASNTADKLLWGMSIGIPILHYENTTTFREQDTSSNTSNKFGSFEYTDHYTTDGTGINFKAGIIYRPVEHIRIGAAIHSPSLIVSMTDKRNTALHVNSEDYNGVSGVESYLFTNNQAGESKYSWITPWKFLISGSYVFRELEDVRKQKAFITTDIEYVRQSSGRFYSGNENASQNEINGFKAVNNIVKSNYKGNFNFRLGGELKFNTIMFRAGGSYATNPYKDNALKADRLQLSGGLGYRHKGFFIDLTYVYTHANNIDFAYRLQDKANTFANIRQNQDNVIVGVGVKF